MVLVTTAGEVGAEAALLLSRQDGTSRVTVASTSLISGGLTGFPSCRSGQSTHSVKKPGSTGVRKPGKSSPAWLDLQKMRGNHDEYTPRLLATESGTSPPTPICGSPGQLHATRRLMSLTAHFEAGSVGYTTHSYCTSFEERP